MTQSMMFDVIEKLPGRRCDPIFDVLVEIYYPDGVPNIPKSIRKGINNVAAGFRSQHAAPYEIREAFKAAQAAHHRGDAAYDAAPGYALLKHFGMFRNQLRQELRRRFYQFRKTIESLNPDFGMNDPITYLGWLKYSANCDPPHLVGALRDAARKDYCMTIFQNLTHLEADAIAQQVEDRVMRIKTLTEKASQLG